MNTMNRLHKYIKSACIYSMVQIAVCRCSTYNFNKFTDHLVDIHNQKFLNKSKPIYKFVDTVCTLVVSGNGGDGCVSFAHEFNNEYAGPSGGNGGRGGHVIVKCKNNTNSLINNDLNHLAEERISAAPGAMGSSSCKNGAKGSDKVVFVPIDTVMTSSDDGEVIHHFKKEGESIFLLEGGAGGRGNKSFTSAMNHSPKEFTKGMPGNAQLITFDIQMASDIALIGLPNSGKSSLFSAMTGIESHISPYVFSSLVPLKGYIYHKYDTYSIIDLPPVIEGSYANKGVGNAFLKHIKYTKCIGLVIDMLCTPISNGLYISNKNNENVPEYHYYTSQYSDEADLSIDSNSKTSNITEPWDALSILLVELESYEEAFVNEKEIVIFANCVDKTHDYYGRSLVDQLNLFKRYVHDQYPNISVYPVSGLMSCYMGIGYNVTSHLSSINLNLESHLIDCIQKIKDRNIKTHFRSSQRVIDNNEEKDSKIKDMYNSNETSICLVEKQLCRNQFNEQNTYEISSNKNLEELEMLTSCSNDTPLAFKLKERGNFNKISYLNESIDLNEDMMEYVAINKNRKKYKY